MKNISLLAPLLGAILLACGQQPTKPQSTQLGLLELHIGHGSGVSRANVTNLQPRLGTIREGDVTFTALSSIATQNDGGFDYIQAQFSITNNSNTAFNNLTLYAVAKNGNIGGTAIKNITTFGGQNDSNEQLRISKLITPMHGVNVGTSGLSLIAGREDFQAFEESEQAALQTALNSGGGGFSSADKALSYGFVARRCIPNCTSPTSFARNIPANTNTGFDKGLITIALKIPRSSGTAYNFTMTFVLVNEPTMRVTKSVLPPESLSAAESRLNSLGSSSSSDEIMQIGLARGITPSSSKTNKGTNVVDTTSDTTNGDASIFALGLDRFTVGGNHACALNAGGKAFCWGNNTRGNLGDNSSTQKLVPTAVNGGLTFSSISAGDSHTCGITTSGSAYCWGWNDNGQIGDNTNLTNRIVPTAITGGHIFSSITTGHAHTCAITTAGAAYCWGLNDNGQLGDTSITQRLIPTLVDGGYTFSSISAGTSHTCAITTTGSAYCWGRNIIGQLGNNTITASLVPVPVNGGYSFSSISAGVSHTCGVTTTATAYCWGENGNGQLGNNSTSASLVPIAVNGSHSFSSIETGSSEYTCGITTSSQAYCWGRNHQGQVGDNTININRLEPKLVNGGLLFARIANGFNHTCGITATGLAYCWGWGGEGRLGNNTTTQSLIPTRDNTLSFKL